MKMKRSHWIRVMSLVLALQAVPHSFVSTAQSREVEKLEVANGALYGWVRRGGLYYRTPAPSLPHEAKKPLVYVYKNPEGIESIVSGDIGNVGTMIQKEIDSLGLETFLRATMSHVLISLMAQPGDALISHDEIAYRAGLPPEIWGSQYDVKRVKDTLDVLKKYENAGNVTYEKERWTLSMYVLLNDGSVEKWSLSGKVGPFTITRYDKEVVEKKGTLMVPRPD